MMCSRDQRRAAVEETKTSVVVEASAGTGKTSALIGRILHLILHQGPEGDPIPLEKICAITFTEKAAGELKIRLRREFEQRSIESGEIGCRARQALEQLERASVSTFHAFAVSLLKERPIEAGLDPQFEALDEIQSELLFYSVYDRWLSRSIHQRAEALECALRRGCGLEAIRRLAGTLYRHSRAVRSLTLPAPLSEQGIQDRLADLDEEGARLHSLNLDRDDKLLPRLEDALWWVSNPSQAKPSKPGSRGAQANWTGGANTVKRVRRFISSIVELSDQLSMMPERRALDDLIRWLITDFLPAWDMEKRNRSLLEFEDQLRCARDLLLNSRAARADFQNRFEVLLVDEFQDTDPIQLELVLLLSSPDGNVDDLTLLRPTPGRLFIVGDPKQSIYRFRGADIETYQALAAPSRLEELGLQRLELTKNYRSVPSILRFVDSAFAAVMAKSKDGDYQPHYLPFGVSGEHRRGIGEHAVHLLGDAFEEGGLAGSGGEYGQMEATRIAKLIGRMVEGDTWRIVRKGSVGDASAKPRYGDIAVLLPVLTSADTIEEALRVEGIPYVLEGGKFYYSRSEVASAITALQAISNPDDPVALYGSLRSIFFGLSDADILREHIEGRPLNYLEPVPRESRFYHPFSVLRELHEKRHQRDASETFESFLLQTGAREVLAVRGYQSLANLGKLSRTLRSLQETRAFPEVLDLLGLMDDEGMAESESRLMEEQGNAVRVMSIHKAKGLDFPIVLVAGLGQRRRTASGDYVEDAHGLGAFGLRVKWGESILHTPDWEDLMTEDRKRQEAELIRLLYVAFTRARDHLVVSTHHKGRDPDGSGRWKPHFKYTRLEPLSNFFQELQKMRETPEIIDVEELDAMVAAAPPPPPAPRRDYGAALEAEYRDLGRLLEETPRAAALSAPSRREAPAEGIGEAVFADRQALRLGRAFHEAMERIDLGADSPFCGSDPMVTVTQGVNLGESRMLQEMVQNCMESTLLLRARKALAAGGKVLREVPYVRSLSREKGIEEGKIDLLFEEPDGWILVDYKTDMIDMDSRDYETYCQRKYGTQIGQYSSALSDAGVRVKKTYVLLARYGREVEVITG